MPSPVPSQATTLSPAPEAGAGAGSPAAVQALVDGFRAGGWARRGPGFVREIRETSIRRFAATGFPATRDEAWRNTSVKPIAAIPFQPAEGPARSLGEGEIAPFRLPGTFEMAFVDGHHVPALDRGDPIPRGIAIQPLSEALRRPHEDLEAHLARHADNDEPFIALNGAFFTDGAVVRLERGASLEAPLHLLHVSTGPARPTASHLRHLVVAGAGAQLSFIESYAGLPSSGASLTTSVTEVVAGANAGVRRVKLQRENLHAFHVGHCAIRQDRDARVQDLLVSVGAALSRNEVDAVLGGPGAQADLDGLFLATGRQHVDCPTRVDHAVPHTSSRELYKGVLDGHARGVFLGSVKVRADAQKTDSAQTNRNLLLSHNALVDTTPQLEIHADDVKCSHGSTIGQLDRDALFFLRARGIAAEEARLLLTQAFAHEVIEKAPPGLKPVLDGLLAQWFACRKVAGVPLE